MLVQHVQEHIKQQGLKATLASKAVELSVAHLAEAKTPARSIFSFQTYKKIIPDRLIFYWGKNISTTALETVNERFTSPMARAGPQIKYNYFLLDWNVERRLLGHHVTSKQKRRGGTNQVIFALKEGLLVLDTKFLLFFQSETFN